MKKLLFCMLVLSLAMSGCGSRNRSDTKEPEKFVEEQAAASMDEDSPQESAEDIICASYGHISPYQPEIFGRIDVDPACGYTVGYWDYVGKDDPHYTVLTDGAGNEIMITVVFMETEYWESEKFEQDGMECISDDSLMLVKAFDIMLDSDEYDTRYYTVCIQQSYNESYSGYLTDIDPALFKYMSVDPNTVSIRYDFKDIDFPFTVINE